MWACLLTYPADQWSPSISPLFLGILNLLLLQQGVAYAASRGDGQALMERCCS